MTSAETAVLGRGSTNGTGVAMDKPPYVVLSCAMSLDGRIDGTGPSRIVLSSIADLARVDTERARSDVIMIGAGTLRRDNPRLRVSPGAARRRAEAGLPAAPLPVVLSRSGDLPDDRALWDGPMRALVYCPPVSARPLRDRLGERAEVVPLTAGPQPWAVLADLAERGMRRVLVEGGEQVHTAFLAAGLASEIQLSVAPMLIGAAGAPRFVRNAPFPCAGQRLHLLDVRVLDDCVLLCYRMRAGAAA